MSESTTIPRLLRVREVAERTNVQKFRVYEAIRSGSLPALKLGRTYRVPENLLLKWIEEQAGQGADQ